MNEENFEKKSGTEYKYLIHKLLNELPHNQYKVTIKELPKKLGISTETFRKWKYIKVDSTATIPGDKLAIIAFFFDIRMEEIFNYEVPKFSVDELLKTENKKFKKS